MDSPPETLEQVQARHRKEAKDLQGRITSKKKNATKKTRKGVNSECDELERAMKERQSAEIAALDGTVNDDEDKEEEEEEEEEIISDDSLEVDSTAERMGALSVDELGAKPPQQPVTESSAVSKEAGAATSQQQQQQGGGGGKKRNRQKERLARRAAETEAAALAAEQEASTQTDHRALEKTNMLAEFAKHGLVEHEIRPDGHCLFSAVADQLAQLDIALDREPGEPGYRAVRRRAAEYIRAHGDEYAGFLEEGVDSYVSKIRDTAEWGGQIELAAVANVWGIGVWVVQDGETEVVRPKEEEGKRIWLAYYRHGYGLGEHYNSLRKKT